MGKTALATNIAYNASQNILKDKKIFVAFFIRNVIRAIINKNFIRTSQNKI